MTYRPSSLQDEYIRLFYEALNCPRSLTAYLLYVNGQFEELVNLEFNPKDYNSVDDARNSLQATKFLSKNIFLPTNIDKQKVALDKFYEAEEQCRLTNLRIKSFAFKTKQTAPIISDMAFKIDKILGEVCAEEFIENCNFGPGATTSMPRYKATLPNKYDFESHISREAHDFVLPWFKLAYPNWDCQLKIAGGSKIVTVPKNAKTDRTIAIEPGINLWFQKGLGSVIRKRLSATGIDLNDQSHNQKKARLGSKFNDLATIDFSSASDTISKEIVRELLPTRWFLLLDTFRSSFGRRKGEVIHFEKFSSMGNGFTFELESLIFYALAIAVCNSLRIPADVSVYGDDVTIPCAAVDLFTEVAADIGFTVNTKKSYSNSYYRESCGSHYYNGIDIKPIFQKEPLNGKAQILLAANNIRRCAYRRNSYGCDRRLLRCWQHLVRPLKDVPRISDGYGDIGVVENIDHPSVIVTKPKYNLEGFYVRCWAPIAYSVYGESKGLLLSKLRAMGISLEPAQADSRDITDSGNKIPLPFRTRQARIRLLIPRWQDLGPWI